MDILIKSFNRPYYLDRCLHSISCFVSHYSRVMVLDDGTPKNYLDRLLEKYPFIEIYTSEYYTEKSSAIGAKQEVTNQSIPIDLWIRAAQEASEHFVLLEDDIWFVEAVDLKVMNTAMLTDHLAMLKLFWLGNPQLIAGQHSQPHSDYTTYLPQLYTLNPYWYYFVFYKFDRFKIRKTLALFGIYSLEKALRYYSIYAVAGAIFNKKYFLHLWDNHQHTVDEGLQLYNAVRYLNQYKDSRFAHSNTEVLQTGFMSSATNSNKSYAEVSIDMMALNGVLNEAWYEGLWNTNLDLSNDLDQATIEQLLQQAQHPQATTEEWNKWVSCFKNQYLAIGCKI